jgi:hypothetical protein
VDRVAAFGEKELPDDGPSRALVSGDAATTR